MVSFALRENLPIDNIKATLLLSQKVKEIEEQYIFQNTNDLSSAHKAYSLSSIYTLVGFLESSINDLYANAKDNVEYLKGIEKHIEKLASFDWRIFRNKLDKQINDNSESNIIRKYQFALQLLEVPFIDPEDKTLKDIILLIKIRNYFTHHFATWIKCDSDVQSEYYILKNRFEENPIYKGKTNPFFPDKLLGYGFLQWALDLSIKFVKYFYDIIGLQYFFIKQLESILEENNKNNSHINLKRT